VVPLQHVLARRRISVLRKDPMAASDRAVNKGNDHREELTNYPPELKDRPDLIEKCASTYPPYGKRILLDNDWTKP
jgi:4-hydroxyacetophenone monooxygenase